MKIYTIKMTFVFVAIVISTYLGSLMSHLKLGNNSCRDFQYAGDAVRMAVELLEKGQFGEVYNMGSEEFVQIYNLAQKIGELMGFERVEIIEDPTRIRKWEIWHLQSALLEAKRQHPQTQSARFRKIKHR